MDITERLVEILEKAANAEVQLSELASVREGSEVIRLNGKREGVSLMAGHIRQLLRDIGDGS